MPIQPNSSLKKARDSKPEKLRYKSLDGEFHPIFESRKTAGCRKSINRFHSCGVNIN